MLVRSPERVTHLNGYRPRLWETCVGEIVARKVDRLVERGMVSPALREVFDALDRAEARRRVGAVLATRSRRSASC
jgi:hypothetical protein